MQRQDQSPAEEQAQDALVALAPADWATADEIRRRSFGTVDSGFDPEEVRAYLGKLAELFAGLNVQLAQARREQSPGRASDGMSELAARMAEVLREAEAHASKVRDEAQEYSERVRLETEAQVEQARAAADRETERAKTEAGQHAATALEEARREASRLIEEATQESERIRTETGGQAYAMLQDAERKMSDVLAMRDAILQELGASWERVSQVAWAGAEAPPPAVTVARPGTAERPHQPEPEIPGQDAGHDGANDSTPGGTSEPANGAREHATSEAAAS